jgi:hypothetical protein
VVFARTYPIAQQPDIEEVIFCCHSAADLAIYQSQLDAAASEARGRTP